MSCRSRKSAYRSQEENEELAETDARLFLTVLHLNAEQGAKEDTILGGSYYLITSSASYLRTAKQVGIRDVVTTRPQSIASLLEVVGETSISSSELIQLFENPFLISAVRESIDDVKRLVESGLDLRGKTLARLKWDLGKVFHSKLALIDQLDEITEEGKDTEKEDRDTYEFISLLKDAKSRDYRLIPQIDNLLNSLEQAQLEARQKSVELQELKKEFEALEGKFSEFGKRKQRFLRRIARKTRGT